MHALKNKTFVISKSASRIVGAGMTLSFVTLAMPVAAQESSDAIVATMLECSDIRESAARVDCYDRVIVPVRKERGYQSSAPIVEPDLSAVEQSDPNEFGRESLPKNARPKISEQQSEAITATVRRSRLRQPGIYAILMEDGAEWLFSEGVPNYFNPPRKGATVEIRRGALGSFRMHIPGQAPVRVTRTR